MCQAINEEVVQLNRDFKVQRHDGKKNLALKENLCSFSLSSNYS